jgi:hypothetical protein
MVLPLLGSLLLRWGLRRKSNAGIRSSAPAAMRGGSRS